MSATEIERTVVDVNEAVPDSESSPGVPTYIAGVITGKLVGFSNEGARPLVMFPGQTGVTAVAAETIVDLHGAHIGRDVVLMFEACDSRRPIVMGWLRSDDGATWSGHSGQVQVEADGERLVVTAREQLVMRCGSASITLTKAGKVLIRGTYVVSHSTGVNRVRGGSVQLN